MITQIPCGITIQSEQSDYTDISRTVLENRTSNENADGEAKTEKVSFYTEGKLSVSPRGRVCISYDESELTGMDGTRTSLNFELSSPGLVTLMRTGSCRMAMVFEKGKRHICTYETPYMPIELCIVTKELKNGITPEGGSFRVEYAIETNSLRSERTLLRIDVRPLDGKGTK